LLAYYGAQGLHQANAILRTATLEIEAGEIDFFQYLQSMQRYTTTRLEYLQTLRNYNLSIIELEYLSE
jgi:cobalt-zinc-cadmium resistance protein CzcA